MCPDMFVSMFMFVVQLPSNFLRPIIFPDQKSIYVQKGEASLVHFVRREQMVRQSHLTDLIVFFKSGNSI